MFRDFCVHLPRFMSDRMFPYRKFALVFLLAFLLSACKEQQKEGTVVTPWGEIKEAEVPSGSGFSLQDIVDNGEMIMLTMSGPETYYDYRGRGMGVHFLLCEKFAQSIGVSLRVELCADTLEMKSKLEKGVADIIVFPLPDAFFGNDSLIACGITKEKDKPSSDEVKGNVQTHSSPGNSKGAWAVSAKNPELASAINNWYQPGMLAEAAKEEKQLLSAPKVTRRVFSPFLNRSGGVISKYDALFQKYAPTARWDWRLMAAQCYQESCFDPNARSWAGARGLMQIMPKTAEHLGLPMEQIHEPESNIRAAAVYLAELSQTFSDIPRTSERNYFVLAAYNGGVGHVRDAMALTKKMGGDPTLWGDVSKHLLLLRDPQYYRDPVVKHGYIRSTETYDYVERIKERYSQYRGVPVRKGFPKAAPRKTSKKFK